MLSPLTNLFNRIYALNSPASSEFVPRLPGHISQITLPLPHLTLHFAGGAEDTLDLFVLGNILDMGSNEIQERTSADIKMKQVKKGRSNNIFKVALFMMRRGKSSRKAAVGADVATKSLWRKLFGSTTTLRLENGKCVTHPVPTTKAAAIVPEDDDKKQLPLTASPLAVVNVYVKVEEKASATQMENPQSSPSCASSSCSAEESRYASAMNLRELDTCNEEEEKEKNDNAEDHDDDDEDCEFDDTAGDSMIDVKAELFIAQFYEQIRLQNSETQVIRG